MPKFIQPIMIDDKIYIFTQVLKTNITGEEMEKFETLGISPEETYQWANIVLFKEGIDYFEEDTEFNGTIIRYHTGETFILRPTFMDFFIAMQTIPAKGKVIFEFLEEAVNNESKDNSKDDSKNNSKDESKEDPKDEDDLKKSLKDLSNKGFDDPMRYLLDD